MNILEEVLKQIPDKSKISDSGFEGANIILYTKDKDFLFSSSETIKKIVDNIKKRVELRPDPAITMDMEEAKKEIEKILSKEAGITNIIFDSQRSIVIIEAEKPGLVIGKGGELLKEIKEKVLWVPLIRRTPAIRSTLIENIRRVLYENSAYRRKFLNKIGERVYGGWTKEKRHEWIRLSFLGGGRQVGRSCLFLQTPESRILLDCGINVAAEGANAYPMLDAPEFKIENLDAVICTHAHLDHSGFIPWLYKMGFRGPLYCTAPTRDVAALLALDFIGVAQKEAKNTLFSSTDVKEMVKHTVCLDYGEVTDITPDVRITLYNSGHTLGSSLVHMHIGNGLHNFVYTGDMKYLRTQLLEPANVRFPRLETLCIESTYGSKDDILPSRKVCEDELIDFIKKVLGRGGKVLIPVLGVGRSQEVMLILESAMREGRLEKQPVYLQGLVWDVTAIHTAYPDFLNRIVRKNIFHRDANPFLSDIFKQIGSKKEQDEVLEEKGPCIIMATSGMLTGGASVEIFKRLADNKRNGLLFTCYQGEGSLGRRIQTGEREIIMQKMEGVETIKVEMEVKTISGLTGHAGRNELLRYVYNLDPRPKKIIVNHGESSKCLELASTIHKSYRVETSTPRNLEAVRLR